jgi:transposase
VRGEVTITEAARRQKISEQSSGRWKAGFLAAGKAGLAAGRAGRSTREPQLEAEVADLAAPLGDLTTVRTRRGEVGANDSKCGAQGALVLLG